jgi:prepilin-type N-terminal cleavage/methylation domain-containing protein
MSIHSSVVSSIDHAKFYLQKESLTVGIRPPKYNSQGFTLVELLITILVGGIIMTFAVPSFLTLNKPLRDGAVQFKSHLSLVRTKAISSNQAYRIRPRYINRPEYITENNPTGIPRNFVVEYANNCKVLTGWQPASQFDLDLPPSVGITDSTDSYFGVTGTPDTVAVANDLNWNICFDSRGIVDTPRQVVIKDFKGNNTAKIAFFDVHKIGGVTFKTYGANPSNNYPINTDLHDNQSLPNPTF